MLDNFATVAEAVQFLQKDPFAVISNQVPGEQGLATLHLSLSDATGDSAIIEYIAGKQVIHHDASYQVMTNSPVFDQQLAFNQFWKQIGGTIFYRAPIASLIDLHVLRFIFMPFLKMQRLSLA